MHIVLTLDPSARFGARCEVMKRVENHLKRTELLASVRFPVAGNYSLCEFHFRDRPGGQPDDSAARLAKRVAIRLKAELMVDSRHHDDGVERIYQYWPERFRGHQVFSGAQLPRSTIHEGGPASARLRTVQSPSGATIPMGASPGKSSGIKATGKASTTTSLAPSPVA